MAIAHTCYRFVFVGMPFGPGFDQTGLRWRSNSVADNVSFMVPYFR
jgi:hypothetical protein